MRETVTEFVVKCNGCLNRIKEGEWSLELTATTGQSLGPRSGKGDYDYCAPCADRISAEIHRKV